MPPSVVTKEYKSLSIADAVEYLNELAKNPDLWQKIVEGNNSEEANEIRENLSDFYGDSELQIVIANRKALSVLYPDLCPQLSTYSSSFAMVFPWFSADLGDIKNSETRNSNSARAASKKENESHLGHGAGGSHESRDFYDDPGELFLTKAGTVRVDSETEKKYHI